MSRPKLMTVDEAMAAVSGNHPIVIETRKYGVVADWYSARNKNEFSEWMRRRVLEGAYPLASVLMEPDENGHNVV